MSESPDPEPARIHRPRVVWLLAVGLTLAATALVLSQTRSFGMLGFDSWPLVLSSRIQDLGDLVGTFSEELADGLYGGDYYRPLLNVSFALDHSLWGLDPLGYQLTNALLYGATGLALFALVRRACGGAGGGALAALLFFLLHDAQFEVLPVPARRPELLCALFGCLALWSQLAARHLEARWPVVPALWMLGAALSKEVGYALPAVAVLAVALYGPARSAGERGRAALRVALVHGAVIGALLLTRVAVLGGLGGPSAAQRASELGLPGRIGRLLTNVFAPQNFGAWRLELQLLAGALVFGLALVALSSRGAPEAGVDRARAPRRALALAGLWIAVVATLHGMSRMVEQWYVFLPVVGVAFGVGAGVELLRSAWQRGTRWRVPVAVTGLLLAAFSFFQIRYSPLLHGYNEWTRATRVADEFLEELAARIEAAPAGQPVDAPPLPRWLPARVDGPALRGTAILDVYSVQAWAELHFPERELLVLAKPPASPPGSGVTIVRILRARRF